MYDDYEELIATTGKNYFLGVKLNSNNEVTNAYACGVKDDVPFCLEGTADGSKYVDNQTLLQRADIYNNTCDANPSFTECGPWDYSGSISAGTYNDGEVIVSVGYDVLCDVFFTGVFYCDESGAIGP